LTETGCPKQEANPCGESDQLIVRINFAKKWLGEAKLKARSEALRQDITNFDF